MAGFIIALRPVGHVVSGMLRVWARLLAHPEAGGAPP